MLTFQLELGFNPTFDCSHLLHRPSCGHYIARDYALHLDAFIKLPSSITSGDHLVLRLQWSL